MKYPMGGLCLLLQFRLAPLLGRVEFGHYTYVRGREVDKDKCIALSGCPISPDAVNAKNYVRFSHFIDDLFVCPGNTDQHFIRMCFADKGIFKTKEGNVAASIDSYLPIVYEGRQHSSTVRASGCQLLVGVAEKRCQQCVAYRGVLRVKFSRWNRSPKATSKFATNASLKTPQRSQKLKRLATVKKAAERKIVQMRKSIAKSIREKGVALPQDLHDDVTSVMNAQGEKIDDIYPKGTFRRLFWDQQFKAASAKSASGMRWHPVMIRLALSLKMASSSAYHIMRTAGVIQLPSERTLSNFSKQKTGFHDDLNDHLLAEAQLDGCSEAQRHVALVFNEMKIRDDLVYRKTSQEIVGFVDLGRVSNEMGDLEKSLSHSAAFQTPINDVATHMLVLMIRGITSGLSFPWAHFPTTGISAGNLMSIMWEAVEILEMLSFKVLCVTSDGAGPNRKFYRMHEASK